MSNNEAIKIFEAAFPQIQERSVNKAAKREIAMALRSIRKEAGLTQGQLAEKANWSQPQVSRLESPQGPLPATETVIKYAVECGAIAQITFRTPLGEQIVANLVEEQKCEPSQAEPID